MKKLLIIALLAMLTGCGWVPVKPNTIITVDTAVPSCPAPPKDIPKCTYAVDALTTADIADPGKVGVAYKADMTCLRTVNGIYLQIIDQYNQTNQNFDAVKANIDKANQALTK